MSDHDEQNAPQAVATLPWDLRLRSLTSTRQSFARLLREYGRGRLERQLFKDLVWALGLYIGALRTEAELDLDTRLSELEVRTRGNR